MSEPLPRNILLSPWRLHSACCGVALLACLPLLWPALSPASEADEPINGYAGWVLSLAFVTSAAGLLLQLVFILLRLHNLRAFLHLLLWLAQWAAAYVVFLLLAMMADVPPPPEPEPGQPIQATDTLHLPHEELTGPASLIIPINPEPYSAEIVQEAPNLTHLAGEQEALLASFIELSPRWTDHRNDDTFYSKPGHVVMVLPESKGTPALIHVGFRRLVEGEPLPRGYTVLKPGEAYPRMPAGGEQAVPDILLDLGGTHYLMLAWRGAPHAESAQRALNAAIDAVDRRLEELRLAEDSNEVIRRMTQSSDRHAGSLPDIRLSEPPTQSGTYQAEIYANPQEPGSLRMRISDLSSGEMLRSFRCEARYSTDSQELFRHDIPLSRSIWVRDDSRGAVRELLPPGTPLFAIREGEAHHYFGVAVDVFFIPTDPEKPQRRLLRRCYKVQAYERPAASGRDGDKPDEGIAPEDESGH